MQSAVLTFNGLMFVLTFLGGIIMAVLVLVGDRQRQVSSVLLAGFFTSIAVSALTKLFIWTEPLKYLAVEHPALSVFGYVLSLLSAGPFMYFYVCSISRSAYRFSFWQYLQFIVPLVVSAIVVLLGASVSHITREADPANLWLYFSVGILGLSPWCYTLLAAAQLKNAKRLLCNYYSGMMDSGARWLDLLVYGYLAVWSWGLFAHFYGGYIFAVAGPEIPTRIGDLNNLLALMLLVSLYFYSISSAFRGLSQALIIEEEPDMEKEVVDQASLIERIVSEGIEAKKLFLESTINVERFAAKLDMRAKDVSVAINLQLGCNFFEFVNRYRVDRAKDLLLNSDLSIQDVMLQSGFNSISSFYRVFKKVVGLSPVQFRTCGDAAV